MPLKKSNKIGVLSDGIAPFHTGGMQSHTRNLIHDLCETFEKVYLVLPRNQELRKAQQVLNLYSTEVRSKLTVILVDRPSAKVKIPGTYLIEEIALSKRLNQALSAVKEDLDFIYAQGFTGWNKEFRIAPVLTHLHGYEFEQKIPGTIYSAKSKFLGFFFRILIKRSDYLISLGGKITEFIKNWE